MAAKSNVGQPIEITYAQRLASNEKKIRERFLKKLKKYLEEKSLSTSDPFTETDFIRLWKGLHYCLWMQDKPLLQEELTDKITQLIHSLKKDDVGLLFLSTFLKTESREWDLLDKWRVDKFMMLIRRMLHQAMLFLKNSSWREPMVKQFSEVITTEIMCPTNDSIPDNLRLHFCDVYLEELEKTGAEQLASGQVLMFLEPFMSFLPFAKNKDVVRQVIKRVFETIHKQAVDDAVESAKRQIEKEEAGGTTQDKEADNDVEEEEEDDDDDNMPIRLDYNFSALADRLFEAGSQQKCLARNRGPIFDLVNKFKDLDKGVFTVEQVIPPGISKRLKKIEKKEKWRQKKKEQRKVEKANKETSKGDQKQKKKKKKKRKRNKSDDNEESIDPDTKDDCNSEKIPKMSDDDIDSNSEEDAIQDDTVTSSVNETGKEEKVFSKIKQKCKVNKKIFEDGSQSCQVTDNIDDDNDDKGNVKCVRNKIEMKVKGEAKTNKRRKQKKSDKSVPNLKTNMASVASEESVSTSCYGDDSVESVERESSIDPKQKGKAGKQKGQTKKKLMTKTSNNGEGLDAVPCDAGESCGTTDVIKDKRVKRKRKGKSLSQQDSGVDEAKKDNQKGDNVTRTECDKENNNGDSAAKKQKCDKKAKEKDTVDGCTKSDGVRCKDSFRDPPEEGEVEIWIPSKKYKGKLKGKFEQQQAENEKLLADAISQEKKYKTKLADKDSSSFAAFEKLVQTPPAFVRKAVSKAMTPASALTRSRQMHKKMQPQSAPVDGRKRVSFGMHKNTAHKIGEKFKTLTPEPFNPDRQPDQGILKKLKGAKVKVTAKANIKATTKIKAKKVTKPKRALASDFF